MTQRFVLHVDMDAFFASVAQLDDRALQGKAVIVGGSSRRGVVTSASYEARAFGVRSAMPMYRAIELCPHAIVVRGTFERYREIHAQLRAIWARHAPAVEVAGFDEAYLEVTGWARDLDGAVAVARAIRRDVEAETGVTCSVGVASGKLLAKVASKKNKPNGLCAVPPGEEAAWLAPMAIGDLHGVGPATAGKLARVGLTRVAQLQAMAEADLVRVIGPWGAALAQMARGIDDRPVEPHGEAKSIGAETTFRHDLTAKDAMAAVIRDLVEEVAWRARKQGVAARTVTVKIRYDDFTTFTRARTLPHATHDDDRLAAAARALLFEHLEPERPVRLLGVSLSHLGTAVQLSLLDAPKAAGKTRLDETLDALRARHGLFVVSRATHLKPRG